MSDLWFAFTVVVVYVVVSAYRERHGPSPYRGRRCTGRAWKRAFPGAPSHQIRKYLQCFVGAMGIPLRALLKFHPDDQVLDVYRALYGGRIPRGDQMECETFAEEVASEFGRPLDDVVGAWHHEVTLGDLFAVMSGRSAGSGERGTTGPNRTA